MVWHIFRKDVRLLWSVVLAVLSVQVLSALRTSLLGYFDKPAILDRLTSLLPLLMYFGIILVAVIAVHQETLSGDRDDWLIRPIRRRDVALAKVLFVLLMVHVPIMAIDVMQQLAWHSDLGTSLAVAADRSLGLLAVFTLPALALGAVTRSFVDACVFGILSAVGVFLLVVAATAVLGPVLFHFYYGTLWITALCAGAVMALGAAIAIAIQYSTRRTLLARVIGVGAAIAALSTFMALPEAPILAAQEWIWGPPGGEQIQMTVDAERRGKALAENLQAQVPIGNAPAAVMMLRAREAHLQSLQMRKVLLPLRITGLHPGDVLFADRISVRIMGLTGTVLYQGAGVCVHSSNGGGANCSNNTLEVWASAHPDTEDSSHDEWLNLPLGLYEQIKDQPVRLEVSYILTRFSARPSQSIKAADDQRGLPEMGTCASRIDDDGDEVELGCLSNVGVPSCASAVLEDPQTGKRNPVLRLCDPIYAPLHRIGFEDAIERSKLTIPFRDPSGLAHYAVDSTAIAHARLVMTNYDAADHFHRSLVIPRMQLAQWTQPGG